MSATAPGLASGNFSIDRASNSIRFERHIPVAPHDIFAAWTEPQQVTQWWDPEGRPLTKCDIDLRVGGRFSFVSAGHPEMPFTGVYRTISPPDLLVFDAMGAEGRVRLESAAGGTRMIVEIICSSPEHMQQFMQMGVAAGTSQTLDNLVAYAAG